MGLTCLRLSESSTREVLAMKEDCGLLADS